MNNIVAYIVLILAVAIMGGFGFNRSAANQYVTVYQNSGGQFHSQSTYYGYLTAWIIALLGGCVLLAGIAFKPVATNSLFNTVWIVILISSVTFVTYLCNKNIKPDFRARTHVERLIVGALVVLSAIAVLTTVGIIFSLLFESLRFFNHVPLSDFLFGTQWSPQMALRPDQAGQSGSFGALAIFSGTVLIMCIAIVIAGPIGLMIAIYLSEYASQTTRTFVKPSLEILAGIPTVVYGFFALLTVGPTLRNFAENLGFSIPTQSAVSAGIVLGLMIIPPNFIAL